MKILLAQKLESCVLPPSFVCVFAYTLHAFLKVPVKISMTKSLEGCLGIIFSERETLCHKFYTFTEQNKNPKPQKEEFDANSIYHFTQKVVLKAPCPF